MRITNSLLIAAELQIRQNGGWAENRPYEPGHPKYDPTDPNKKKHPETQYFLYYSKNINGKKYWANVKMHRDYNGEVIYTIEPKEPEDLIRGIP